MTDRGFRTPLKPYSMFFAACAFALLGLVSVSHSASLGCEDLLRPLDETDLHHLQGRWALVAGSVKDPASEGLLRGRESVAIHLHNSTYTQANRVQGVCSYHPHDISREGQIFTLKERDYNFTVTFLNTTCPDCMVFTFDIESPTYKSRDFYLISRRREVDQREMEEFRAQVECLKMPPPVEMDPAKELCPDQTASEPEAPKEEKVEGQQA